MEATSIIWNTLHTISSQTTTNNSHHQKKMETRINHIVRLWTFLTGISGRIYMLLVMMRIVIKTLSEANLTPFRALYILFIVRLDSKKIR